MNQIKDVQPIRSKQQIEDMKWALKRHCSERITYYSLLVLIRITCRRSFEVKTSDVIRRKIVKVSEGKQRKSVKLIY